MTYAEIVIDFLHKWGMITHRKIMEITGCNCPYSVLACVKRRLSLEWKQHLQVKLKKLSRVNLTTCTF